MDDNLGDALSDIQYTVLGLDYKINHLTYGFSYYNKDDRVNRFEMDRYTLGVNYKILSGLSLRSNFIHYDLADADSTATANAILIGTDINF